MSFLFGRLTQDFVNFASTLTAAGDQNDLQAQGAAAAQLTAAFKHSAALNATYLVYIGMFTF